MRFASHFLVLLCCASIADAVPFCTPSGNTYCFTNVFPQDGHVIGDQTKFSIEAVSITLDSIITVKIRTNFDNIGLNPFTVAGNTKSYTLEVGDFFFTSGDGTFKYGIPLRTHAGTINNPGLTAGTVTAGHLYSIDNVANGTVTSNQAMNDVGDISYNKNVTVWLRNFAGAITDLNVGSPSVSVAATGGNGVTQAKFDITTSFARPANPSDPFNLLFAGSWGFLFASADCANDYFGGRVPEPGTIVLLSGGLLALALRYRLRKGRS